MRPPVENSSVVHYRPGSPVPARFILRPWPATTGPSTATLSAANRQQGSEAAFKVKSIGDVKFDAPAPVTFKIGLEAFIDGSSSTGKMSATITISGKATMEQGGMKFTLEIKMNGEGTLDQSETK